MSKLVKVNSVESSVCMLQPTTVASSLECDHNGCLRPKHALALALRGGPATPLIACNKKSHVGVELAVKTQDTGDIDGGGDEGCFHFVSPLSRQSRKTFLICCAAVRSWSFATRCT